MSAQSPEEPNPVTCPSALYPQGLHAWEPSHQEGAGQAGPEEEEVGAEIEVRVALDVHLSVSRYLAW